MVASPLKGLKTPVLGYQISVCMLLYPLYLITICSKATSSIWCVGLFNIFNNLNLPQSTLKHYSLLTTCLTDDYKQRNCFSDRLMHPLSQCRRIHKHLALLF